ncbi:hypothetical protein GOZ89_17190 [Agrobacterium vitis]|uniref:Uncharacterized protein n=1 Tax=Agrobacterium vitis TaxID=373 RepID=A0A6I4G6W0_AGRVI|nr:hypothetical protein [Agrobacterium vitis]MUZ73378.1 hypothetical protein [Agrobacterium vitis]MVA56036.1 hypothetical protein [Agrobacterium vitis]MVA81160.1 hypothetical protein [Agrobacterium vitis]
MGLDLVVEGCAKAGHEVEWRRLIERVFANDELSDADIARFNEISTPAYENVGAPRVGYDAAADAWIIKAQQAQTSDEIAQTLMQFHGHYVLQLVECDGLPVYSNAGFYDGVDETSFRGSFLEDCTNVISDKMLAEAWEHKLPGAALDYGRALLEAAHAAETSPREKRKSLLSRLSFSKPAATLPLQEQMDIVRAAGQWFMFWGELGHPIRAYF